MQTLIQIFSHSGEYALQSAVNSWLASHDVTVSAMQTMATVIDNGDSTGLVRVEYMLILLYTTKDVEGSVWRGGLAQ